MAEFDFQPDIVEQVDEVKGTTANLPAVLQTHPNERVLSATADHLFSKTKIEKITGYIGNIRNPGIDHHIEGSDIERNARGLEPCCVIRNAETNAITGALFYDDMVRILGGQGALTDRQDRLFATPSHSFMPPVNIDMLVNYQDYYWYPEATTTNENGDIELVRPPAISFPNNIRDVDGITIKFINGNELVTNELDAMEIANEGNRTLEGYLKRISNLRYLTINNIHFVNGMIVSLREITSEAGRNKSLEANTTYEILEIDDMDTNWTHISSELTDVKKGMIFKTGGTRPTFNTSDVGTDAKVRKLSIVAGVGVRSHQSMHFINYEIGPADAPKDYIVVERTDDNRSNEWTKGNYWFHKDALLVASANNQFGLIEEIRQLEWNPEEEITAGSSTMLTANKRYIVTFPGGTTSGQDFTADRNWSGLTGVTWEGSATGNPVREGDVLQVGSADVAFSSTTASEDARVVQTFTLITAPGPDNGLDFNTTYVVHNVGGDTNWSGLTNVNWNGDATGNPVKAGDTFTTIEGTERTQKAFINTSATSSGAQIYNQNELTNTDGWDSTAWDAEIKNIPHDFRIDPARQAKFPIIQFPAPSPGSSLISPKSNTVNKVPIYAGAGLPSFIFSEQKIENAGKVNERKVPYVYEPGFVFHVNPNNLGHGGYTQNLRPTDITQKKTNNQWDIPHSLEANAENKLIGGIDPDTEEPDYTSLEQLRLHFESIIENQTDIDNLGYDNTLQDGSKGTYILYHDYPMFLPGYLLAKRDIVDLPVAIRQSVSDYEKLKYKIINNASEYENLSGDALLKAVAIPGKYADNNGIPWTPALSGIAMRTTPSNNASTNHVTCHDGSKEYNLTARQRNALHAFETALWAKHSSDLPSLPQITSFFHRDFYSDRFLLCDELTAPAGTLYANDRYIFTHVTETDLSGLNTMILTFPIQWDEGVDPSNVRVGDGFTVGNRVNTQDFNSNFGDGARVVRNCFNDYSLDETHNMFVPIYNQWRTLHGLPDELASMNAFKDSSAGRAAIAEVLYLLKPAEFINRGWVMSSVSQGALSKKKISDNVHWRTENNVNQIVYGYQPFIRNYLEHKNLPYTTHFTDDIATTQINMGVRTGSFIDSDSLRIETVEAPQ